MTKKAQRTGRKKEKYGFEQILYHKRYMEGN